MATVDSSSTRTEIVAAILDNASYLEDASVVKAKALVTALNCYLVKHPREAAVGGQGGESVTLPIEQLHEMKREASAYVSSNAGTAAGGGGVIHADLRNFRE